MKYFGTDGFRGEANQDLTLYHAIKIGRFLGYYFNKEKNGNGKIVIGKDTRRSSYMFEDALSAGITSSGSDAYLLHVTTTPSVSYVVRSEDFDCGVMITASHNPYHDNGIKIINSDGEKMDDEFLQKLEDYIDADIKDIDLKPIHIIQKLKPDFVLSFNYTRTYEKIYGDVIIQHIHGVVA